MTALDVIADALEWADEPYVEAQLVIDKLTEAGFSIARAEDEE
jgi:hypothetical protein